jgi:hypothetical protein
VSVRTAITPYQGACIAVPVFSYVQPPRPRVQGRQNIPRRVLEELHSNVASRSNKEQPLKRPRLTGTQQLPPPSLPSSEDPVQLLQPRRRSSSIDPLQQSFLPSL